MKSAIRPTLVAVLLGSMSAVATAGNVPNDVPQRTVHYADLNLTSSSGVVALYQRIRFAARAVCEPAAFSDLQWQAQGVRCTHEAIQRAVYEVNAPLLTGYYLAKNRPAITVAQR
jgi:UrcA family protein